MKKAICSFIYYKLLGWKTEVSAPDFDKFIMCAAPHTTNWDLIIGKLFMGAIGRETGFMMKKDWFFWPMGPIFRMMGGIPVDRSRKTSLVDQMVKQAKESTKFHLAITPEGTRKANPNWKKGFYHIALGANLPILLVAIDYKRKCITCDKVIYPSGDINKDMQEIKLYYKDFKGKYPENFSIGKVD
ncbi:MAG: lysophospholipid acyltransferase family protein [Phocaeicola sp.]